MGRTLWQMNLRYGSPKYAAQQAHEPDTLIEDSIPACLGFAAFRFVGGDTAKPACSLCTVRWAAIPNSLHEMQQQEVACPAGIAPQSCSP